ncbi:MAG: cupin domain-containing protein [Candidatus Promineifilaceae bacterium]|jgi:predicted cupin superfamily sugar epimerase
MNIEWLIQHFGLQELPVEGGIYTQTYISDEIIAAEALPGRYMSDKPFGTAIVYLLRPGANSFSAMHKLPTDEVYHFYLGDPVEMLNLHPDGRSERILLGQDLPNGQLIQHTVPRDVWQGSHLLPGGEWALVGTTMAPGFTAEDYVGGARETLIAAFPQWSDLITTLTRPQSPLHME